jgi:hypothetical protein
MNPEYALPLAKQAEESEIPSQLPGLSIAQTTFFYRLRERAAKYEIPLTITPDGEIVEHGRDGRGNSWGNIHDEVRVARLIGTMIDASLTGEEVIRMMFELFPGSTKLGFLFERGDN